MNQYAGILVVTTDGRLALQQRDNIPSIKNPGKISTFGGAVETGESLRLAAVRELEEEASTKLDPNSLEEFGTYQQTQELDGHDTTVHIFLARNVNPQNLIIKEGKSVHFITPGEDLISLNCTRICRLVLQDYLSKN